MAPVVGAEKRQSPVLSFHGVLELPPPIYDYNSAMTSSEFQQQQLPTSLVESLEKTDDQNDFRAFSRAQIDRHKQTYKRSLGGRRHCGQNVTTRRNGESIVSLNGSHRADDDDDNAMIEGRRSEEAGAR